MNCGRTLFLVIAIILTILAIAFGIVAFLTPSWQVVFVEEYQVEHQHGLWMDCTRHRKRVLGNVRLIVVNENTNYHKTSSKPPGELLFRL